MGYLRRGSGLEMRVLGVGNVSVSHGSVIDFKVDTTDCEERFSLEVFF